MEKSKSIQYRIIKPLITVGVIALLGYNSIYVKTLKRAHASVAGSNFKASDFSNKLWNEQLPLKIDSAVQLVQLIPLLQSNSEQAFLTYSHALAIGNIRYFLVRFTGSVTKINQDDMDIRILDGDSTVDLKLATEFVYGNAIRDASGLVNVNDFTNSSDLNAISEELNKIVRNNVILAFKRTIKVGDKVEIVGAVELNKEHFDIHDIEVIPLRLTLLSK
jgi:predicted lipoprotein